jgi:hypothetical protein
MMMSCELWTAERGARGATLSTLLKIAESLNLALGYASTWYLVPVLHKQQ